MALLLIALSIPTFQGMFAMTGTPSILVPSSSVHAGSMSAHVKKPTTSYATSNRTQLQDRGSWKYLVEASKKVIRSLQRACFVRGLDGTEPVAAKEQMTGSVFS
ncbi:hypothetical protein EDD15DRAFT_2318332 [Pisolithus albus]|nr:hypothetical protein EDD15DRAFT_2318332 [Pisolithus albus]